jgi:glycolate oxidase iron-sulfur subunit
MSEKTTKWAEQLDFAEISNCMRCGFCLPACPTYQQTGLEIASPRGRIAMMKAVAKGELDVTDAFADAMYLCLGCRACESACPAGVKYGRLVEGAREVVETVKRRSVKVRLARRLTMNALFPSAKRMTRIGNLVSLMQRTHLDTAAQKLGMMKLLPKSLAEMQKALPPVVSAKDRKQRQRVVPAKGKKKLRVGLFTGCVMDAVFFQTNENTARVLSAAGCEVVYVDNQTCCGALHAHSGDKHGALELAKRNIEVFEQSNVDVYVNNAGGCGAALKEYVHWFAHDPEWRERAQRFSDKMKDFNELLDTLQLPDMKTLPYRVTYQDSCHLAHGQGVRSQPRSLIRKIPGITFVEMPNADSCCGSAGIYNITQFHMSMQILDDKMKHVADTAADVVVTSNPGCLLQMRLGIKRAGLQHKMRVVHIADLLAEALVE